VNTAVTVTLHSALVEVAHGTTDADGAVTLSATIPADTTAGAHTVQASVGDEVLASSALSVTAASTVPTQPSNPSPGANAGDAGSGAGSGANAHGADATLARTGSDIAVPGMLALLMIAAGAIAVLRRRRPTTKKSSV